MKKIFFLFFLFILFSGLNAQTRVYHLDYIDFNKNGIKDKFEDVSLPTINRVEDLLSKMSLSEKEGQLLTGYGWLMYERKGDEVFLSDYFKSMISTKPWGGLWGLLRADPWTQKNHITGLNPNLSPKFVNTLQRYTIENTRLGIPMLISEECAHGVMSIGTTVFPTGLGQASTWNPQLIEKMARIIALEARSQGVTIGYGPVLDLAKDPRWSRVEETYGEDYFLVSKMGEAMVRGFQYGKNDSINLRDKTTIASTLKHFAAYGSSEGGHNGASVNIGERQLYSEILKPFHKAVAIGASSVMTSYNEIDGVPCSSNKYLITDILKNKWGFRGMVVSDLFSIAGLVNHGVARDKNEASLRAISAGVDMDLSAKDFENNIEALVNSGELDISIVDNAVRRILELKFNLGLFDNPFVNENTKPFNKEHKEIARAVAKESITLLKNKDNILPLKTNQRIALIGPNADNVYNMLGDYTAPQLEKDVITLRKALESRFKNQSLIAYSKGCAIRDTSRKDFNQALEIAKDADIIVMCMGGSSARDFSSEFEITGAARVSENANSDMDCGEGYDRSSLELLGVQNELLEKVKELGKPIVLVLIKGRPLILNWANDNVDAIIDAWYPGMEGGNSIVDVLYGDYNPAGRLPISIPRSEGQIPIYYNYRGKSIRSNYIDEKGIPLFNFGYGLSYTDFKYRSIKVNKIENKLSVDIEVENIGDRDGDEVVQVYFKKLYGEYTCVEKQLKAFNRTHIKKKEIKNIYFEFSEQDFLEYKTSGEFGFEASEYEIMVGGSSDNLPLKESIKYTISK